MKSINFTDPKMVKIFDAVVNHYDYETFMNAFEWKSINGLALERNPKLDLETQVILRIEMTISLMRTINSTIDTKCIDINEETNELIFRNNMFFTCYRHNKKDYEQNLLYMNFEYSPENSDYESVIESRRVYKEAGKILFS